jgi:hypothetical protein
MSERNDVRRRSKAIGFVLAALITVAAAPTPAQADNNNNAREAAKHFQRGVDLYNDGDFRGALVEFKTAYSTWPRANVLYDIGQTEYQLLDYASALKTMERYLAETGASAPHRQDVEAAVEVLRGRVGRVAVTSEAGCEVTVDDQSAGTTPLDAPVLVSVGQRRLAVNCAGQRTASKRVEVAAGQTVALELRPAGAPPPPPGVRNLTATVEKKPLPPSKSYVTAWIATGVLVGGVVALGTTTLVEQSKLNAMRGSYPVAASDLNHQQSLTTGLAIASDVIGVGALVSAGVATYLTIKHAKSERGGKRFTVGAAGNGVGGTF